MSSESPALTTIVARIIEMHRDEPRINAQTIATAALLEIDPGKVSLPPVLAGCHLALHQIARGLLRKRFDEDDEDGDEDQMLPFPGLQQRYPSFKQGASDREYVLLEKMFPADIAFNVARLRKEGATKSKHADALEAWWEIKQAAAAVSQAA